MKKNQLDLLIFSVFVANILLLSIDIDIIFRAIILSFSMALTHWIAGKQDKDEEL